MLVAKSRPWIWPLIWCTQETFDQFSANRSSKTRPHKKAVSYWLSALSQTPGRRFFHVRIQNPESRIRTTAFGLHASTRRSGLRCSLNSQPSTLFCHFATPASEAFNSTFSGTPAAKNGLVSQHLEPAWCDTIAVFCHMESSSASALQYSKITTADRPVVALQLTYSPTHLLTYSPTPHEIQHFKTIRTQPVVPQHVTIHADQVMK
jgi:hypothetical protein